MSDFKPPNVQTNFLDSNGDDLGEKLVTKDYLISVYPSIRPGLGITPELWGWGSGFENLLFSTYYSTPTTTLAGGIDWRQVSCGGDFTAAIKRDGTLWTWGVNTIGSLGGQLGINANGTPSPYGQSVPNTTFAGGSDWLKVHTSLNACFAIKTDGTLWVWGVNSLGELGTNDSGVSKLTPVTTFAGGNNWREVVCGYYHTAAIKTDGTLWTWGQNLYGELGTNGGGNRITPVTTFLGGNDWKSVSVVNSDFATAAIKTDGSLWVWGRNISLGINNGNGSTGTPVTTFLGGNDWEKIGGGRVFSAIKTDGSLWVWGVNNNGLLGTNDNRTRSTPVTTFAGGNNWKQACSSLNTRPEEGSFAAIKTDGSLWVWGSNNNILKLGINRGNTVRSTPVTTFIGGYNWKQVSVGRYHAAAIKSQDVI